MLALPVLRVRSCGNAGCWRWRGCTLIVVERAWRGGFAAHRARLCRRGNTNIKPADSRYDCGTNGGQVTAQVSAW